MGTSDFGVSHKKYVSTANKLLKSTEIKRRTRALKEEALYIMQTGRKQNRVARSLKRAWKYKGGKKKLKKLGVTAGITTAVIFLGIATHGAGIGVVIAIAAGEYAVGRMSDVGFAGLYGKKYTGAKKTAGFILEHRKNPVAFDNGGESRRLASRAHKTIRRACQHYRKAHKKSLATKNRGSVKSCDDGSERLTRVFQAKHHFDKALLYIHPGFYLTEALFKTYDKAVKDWEDKREAELNRHIADVFSAHDGEACSDKCYAVPNKQNRGQFAPTSEDLWDKAKRTKIEAELDKAHKALNSHFNLYLYSRGGLILQQAPEGTEELYEDTVARYSKRGTGTKFKHFFANNWARKTKSEKRAFVASQVLALVASGSGVGLDKGSELAPEGIKMLIEYGAMLGETLWDQDIDAIAEAASGKQSSDQGTGEAREGQECLQNASIHIQEALKAIPLSERGKDDWEDLDTCEEALDKMAAWYKYRHHLWKTQKYLKEAIEIVTKCVEALEVDFAALTRRHDRLCVRIGEFMDKEDHSQCKNKSLCVAG